MTDLVELKNKFESKCSIKIETNSKGHNTTVHVYEAVSFQEIDDIVEKAIYTHCNVQSKLLNRMNVKKHAEILDDYNVSIVDQFSFKDLRENGGANQTLLVLGSNNPMDNVISVLKKDYFKTAVWVIRFCLSRTWIFHYTTVFFGHT
ncbi:MAG: hypothetical protein WCB31_00595 [Nitrososphaeraceae archaeon]